MGEKFIGKRITELRLMRNVSEYQMSLELGQSKSYVQGITSGKSLPSIKQLYNIADYFNMSLAEFSMNQRWILQYFVKLGTKRRN